MKKTILIVEDEISERKALSDKFNREGINVIYAVNGEEGLQMALEKHPDLIVADILMPKMNGIEMIKKLRDDDWEASIGQTAIHFQFSKAEQNLPDHQKESNLNRLNLYNFWKLK